MCHFFYVVVVRFYRMGTYLLWGEMIRIHLLSQILRGTGLRSELRKLNIQMGIQIANHSPANVRWGPQRFHYTVTAPAV